MEYRRVAAGGDAMSGDITRIQRSRIDGWQTYVCDRVEIAVNAHTRTVVISARTGATVLAFEDCGDLYELLTLAEIASAMGLRID